MHNHRLGQGDKECARVYDEFWAPIFAEAEAEGVPFEVQLRRELADYRQWMRNWSEVAVFISGGKLSKINYTTDVYLDAHREELERSYMDGRHDALEEHSLEPQTCTREQPHDGPCNGWPCEYVRGKTG